jgi:hypothetical protein
VDCPDEVGVRHRHLFEDGTPYLNYYLVPVDVINKYLPFWYERWS